MGVLALLVIERHQPDEGVLGVLDGVARDRAGRQRGGCEDARRQSEEHDQFAHTTASPRIASPLVEAPYLSHVGAPFRGGCRPPSIA